MATAPSTSPELRVDLLTGRQVIVASGRSQRPITARSEPGCTADYDPFLEGNEHDTPHERIALRKPDSVEDEPGWLLRIVPNRYPAVVVQSTDSVATLSGVHDVIIECPDDRRMLTDLTTYEIARILFAWQLRWRQLSEDDTLKAVSVFRNEGRQAGASLVHCHSQILATNFIGQQLAQRVANADQFPQRAGRRLFDHWLAFERSDGRRVIDETESLVTLCPYASRVDYHVRIVPKATAFQDFGSLDAAALLELAGCLLHSATAIRDVCVGPDYNLALVLPPTQAPQAFPWMLDLLPRRNRLAGFEFLSDTEILTVTPECAAKQLRAASSETPVRELMSTDAVNQICPVGYQWVAGTGYELHI